jgi:hypothetical protein
LHKANGWNIFSSLISHRNWTQLKTLEIKKQAGIYEMFCPLNWQVSIFSIATAGWNIA